MVFRVACIKLCEYDLTSTIELSNIKVKGTDAVKMSVIIKIIIKYLF